jgi:hypothetical protein
MTDRAASGADAAPNGNGTTVHPLETPVKGSPVVPMMGP